MVPSLPRP